MRKMVSNLIRQHFYIIFGVFLGFCFGPALIPVLENGCFRSSSSYQSSYDGEGISDEFVPRINLEAKPLKAQRSPQKLLRPRYFSTELGIRKKLFVAVLTTQTTINTRGILVNKTASHLVDKLTFFIDAPGTQKLNVSYLNLHGIVGFIDTRMVLKPFHVLKYITDNLIEFYDYFFVINDNAYIKARKLYEIVNRISISQDVYAGRSSKGSPFCSLDAGILFSNSIIRSMMSNIDWCIKNVLSSSDDDNFGRCVLYSSKISCQQEVQGNKFSSFLLQNDQELNVNLLETEEMNEALTVYPIKNIESYYLLHAYFANADLRKTDEDIAALRKSIVEKAPFTPDGTDSVTWPIGNQPHSKPATRFDVTRWDYFTENHIYLSDEFSTLRRLNEAEKEDIKVVLNAAVDFIKKKYEKSLSFHSLANGYRRYDASRGMDYILDIAFRDDTNEIILKRIEICKPLGKVEMLSVPYVTENRRVNIILPVRVDDRETAINFLQQYKTECLEKKEKIFLMLVLIYEYNAPGKGTKDDVFQDLKNLALSLTKMYQRDDNRVAWLSMKLPFSDNIGVREALLDFAVLDLSLKKFSADSLILLGRPIMDVKIEYLNRVRMNTILGWQIFAPVPFSEFNPAVHGIQEPYIDVSRKYGRFNSYNTEHLSFYAKDYFVVRKKIDKLIPPIKSDSDIRLLRGNELDEKNFTNLAMNSIYGMFVRYGDIHVIRGVEPALKLQFRETDCSVFDNSTDSIVTNLRINCLRKRNAALGSRSQLAKLLLDYQEMTGSDLTH